jgi:hypothetical protein
MKRPYYHAIAEANRLAAEQLRDKPYDVPIEQQVATLRAALEAVEWSPYCVSCGREESDGHAPDCIVGKALGRV